MQMDNALYYTFSTIAQVLGTAITLLAAFVLYQIQSLNQRIWGFQHNAVFSYFPSQDLEKYIQNDNQILISEYIQKTHPLRDPQACVRERKAFISLVEQKKEIICLLRRSFLVTAAEIIFSVAAIPFVPIIGKYNIAIVVVLSGVGLLFLAGLQFYFKLMMKSLG
jgi:hypothetical protein